MKKVFQFGFFLFLITGIFGDIIAQGPPTQADKKAEALMKSKKFAEAIPYLNEMIKLEPKNIKWYFDKGVCESKAKKFEDAKVTFAKVIEMNSKHTGAYVQLANVHLRQKNYDEANKYFQQAHDLEANPAKKSQLKMMMLDAMVQKGDLPKAKVYLADLQKSAPENMKVMYYAGEIKVKEKNWSGAKDEYNKIVANPKFATMKPAQQAQYYYSLGLCYLEMGDEVNAQKNWRKANSGKYADLIAKRKPMWAVEFAEPENENLTDETPSELSEFNTTPSSGTSSSPSYEEPADSGSTSGSLDWGF
ncbi:MAG: tetratricopeptide repeat protein [Bacteroidia bacterium]|nr:tetratricopeptide repeat protein [Bacteroidia bacterium]